MNGDHPAESARAAARRVPWRFFRENLKLGEGGEEGRDNDIARETYERAGVSVMGKRMFDLGEQLWPEEGKRVVPLSITHNFLSYSS